MDKEGIEGLVKMVNASRGEDALNATDLADSFEIRWPAFETAFQKLPARVIDAEHTDVRRTNRQQEVSVVFSKYNGAEHTDVRRTNRQVLEDVLDTVRDIAAGRTTVSYSGTALKVTPFTGFTSSQMEDAVRAQDEEDEKNLIGDAMLTRFKQKHSKDRSDLFAMLSHCKKAVYDRSVLRLYFDRGISMAQAEIEKVFNEISPLFREEFPRVKIEFVFGL